MSNRECFSCTLLQAEGEAHFRNRVSIDQSSEVAAVPCPARESENQFAGAGGLGITLSGRPAIATLWHL